LRRQTTATTAHGLCLRQLRRVAGGGVGVRVAVWCRWLRSLSDDAMPLPASSVPRCRCCCAVRALPLACSGPALPSDDTDDADDGAEPPLPLPPIEGS
jgi:hypothetical protein